MNSTEWNPVGEEIPTPNNPEWVEQNKAKNVINLTSDILKEIKFLRLSNEMKNPYVSLFN